VDEAVLDTAAGGRQIRRRHLDPQGGFAIDAVAQGRSRLDHRREGGNTEPLRFGIALGDKDVAPHPTLLEVAAIVPSSKPASCIVLRYSAVRWRVTSIDCTFIRNGRPRRASSSSDASPEAARISCGCGCV